MRFQRTIKGFNIGKDGVNSFSKSIRLGKLANLNLNISSQGLSVSASLPGTGLSTGPIRLVDFEGEQRVKPARHRNNASHGPTAR